MRVSEIVKYNGTSADKLGTSNHLVRRDRVNFNSSLFKSVFFGTWLRFTYFEKFLRAYLLTTSYLQC